MSRITRILTSIAASALVALTPLALTPTLSPTPAFAGDAMAYTDAAFKNAQAADKHIVVEVFKTGCPTCKLQQPGLKDARTKFPDATFLKVDFENDAGPVKMFNAVKQSTIIVYKGKQEVARSVGETDSGAIVGLIAKGA